jgi:NitT/TauT family transport system substrate-binding protein
MMVYNNTPATVFTLKRYNIQRPSQLSGRKLGAPGFDAGRRTFGAFAKYNDVQVANWTTMDPPLREQMLLSGEVEAITGFGFTSQLNLEAKGAKSDDIITFPFKDYGVKLYGNAIIASPKLIQEKPEALRAFLSAFTQGVKEVVRDPNDTINTILVRDPKANIKLETKRLQLAIDTVINSPDARREGFGRVHPVRLQQMAKQITDTLNTKQAVKAQDVWNGSFLPSPDVLDGVLRR